MAYYYSSNPPENYDNYQYYQYNYNHDSNYEQRYVQNYGTEYYANSYQYVPPSSFVGYHHYSTYNNQPNVLTSKSASFYENGEYYDPVSTQYVVSYNTAPAAEEATDVVIEDEGPKPFHGGYDIHEKYGEPLPASEEICHPPSKIDPSNASSLEGFSYGSVPPAYGKEDKKDVVGEEPKKSDGIATDSKVIQEEHPSDFEDDEEEEEDDYDDDDDDDDDDDEGEEDEYEEEHEEEPLKNNPNASLGDALPTKVDQPGESEAKPKHVTWADEVVQEEKASDVEEEKKGEEIRGDSGDQGGKREDYGNQIRRQIPPGYGIEAIDLCEGVFGGYFPCLWKRNQRVYNHERDVNDKVSEYDYCWNETADYLFGNPNPYGGTMPEKGSYGDPVYNYQRYHPQQPLTEQVQYYGGNTSYW